MTPAILTTERLILRPWREEDKEPFARLNADPTVMEFFPALFTKEKSDRMVDDFMEAFARLGWGLWAAELRGVFIGMIGLNRVAFTAPFTPAVEVGWRLARQYWGEGYATEGARAALDYGFKTLELLEIVSFTTPMNVRSRRVMERLGMHHRSEDDFDHPKVEASSRFCRHVLYRLRREEWV